MNRATPFVIEMIDMEDPRDPMRIDGYRREGRWKLVAVSAAVMLAVIFMISDRTLEKAGSEAVGESPAEPVAPMPVDVGKGRSISPLSGADVDHEPYFIGHPGSGSPILGVDSDLTVVYVNSLGRPTVVNLDTGDVSEYEVAATRSRDRLVVELGEIVTLDPERLNVGVAGDRAIVFRVRRPGLVGARGERSDPVDGRYSGVELCLAASGCVSGQPDSRPFIQGADSVELLSEAGRTDVMELFDRRLGVRDHRFLVVSSEHVQGYRVPEPLGDVIWLVHQPDGSA